MFYSRIYPLRLLYCGLSSRTLLQRRRPSHLAGHLPRTNTSKPSPPLVLWVVITPSLTNTPPSLFAGLFARTKPPKAPRRPLTLRVSPHIAGRLRALPPPKNSSALPHFAGPLVRPPKAPRHSLHFAGRLHVLRVGFYLPTRFRGLRDHETTRPRDTCTPKRAPSRCGSPCTCQPPKRHSPHFAGHLLRTVPQNATPLTLRVVITILGIISQCPKSQIIGYYTAHYTYKSIIAD